MEFIINETVYPIYQRDPSSSDASVYFTEAPLPSSKITALHFHRLAEIGICLQGSGVNHVGNRIYHFTAGDMQYIPANVPHLSTADEDTDCVWAWISLNCEKIVAENFEQLSSSLLFLQQKSFSGVFHPKEHPALAEMINRLYDTLKRCDAFFAFDIAFLTGEILVESARIGNIDGIGQDEYAFKSRNLIPAITYIQENYANPEEMNEKIIAQKAGYSVSHFRRIFKEETGLTVQQFILKTRLSASAYLLQTTDASILTVALRTGFGDVSNFYRIFRKYYSCSPAKYRLQFKRTVQSLRT